MDTLGNFTIEIDALNKCGNSSSSMNVSVVNQFGISIFGDTIGCEGDSLFLYADGEGSITWSDGGNTSQFLDVFTIGDTMVSVATNNYCGAFNDSVSLVVIPTSLLDLGNDTTIFAGESIVLNGAGGSSYSWSPSDGLSCDNCPNLLQKH